ncbi:MAG: D-alanine--D-alanine ligase family protein [Acidobacteriota bacterium]
MREKLKIGIIFGGKSVEHEVSIVSAKGVMAVIDREKFDVIPIGVTKEGRWLSPEDSIRLLNGERIDNDGLNLLVVGSNHFKGLIEIDDPSAADSGKRSDKDNRRHINRKNRTLIMDVVFPLIHGAYGEDGKLQGMLELAGIPYVGAGPLSSALGMDKDLMKKLFTLNGIPVAEHRVIYWHEWKNDKDTAAESSVAHLGIPLFVKPANTGSSVGIIKVKEKGKVMPAIENAFGYDNKVILERAIDAREIECSVLGNETPMASIPGEVIPCNEFYDYRAKYIDDRSELIIPASLSEEQVAIVQDLSIRAFRTLECSGMARVDLFLERGTGKFYVNELNTIPGFTPISMYPKLWEASGISYTELITRLIDLGLQRHRLTSRLKTSYSP